MFSCTFYCAVPFESNECILKIEGCWVVCIGLIGRRDPNTDFVAIGQADALKFIKVIKFHSVWRFELGIFGGDRLEV